MYVNVIVDITSEKLDKVFAYHLPENLEDQIMVGDLVVVPFGKGNREITGFVLSVSESVDFDASRIKDVLRKSDRGVSIESKLISLAGWIKENYGGTMVQALKTVLPIKKKQNVKQKKTVRLLLPKEEAEALLDTYVAKHQKARARVLEGLLEMPEQDYSLITKKLNVSGTVLKAMEEKKVLEVDSQASYRNPARQQMMRLKEQNSDLEIAEGAETTERAGRYKKRITLNDEQQAAVSRFVTDYDQGLRETYLLYGVTGSGKTEVYMEMIQHVIDDGKQVIMLIPEIALTYQTVLRFYARFGDRVSILHSRLSPGERSDQMELVKAGKVDVMIGPRSALFTPFANLGLIVMDEEHENSYKSEQIPRYHARETAVERAKLEGAAVVLGSATPSMEAFYRCQTGEYKLLQLKERAARQNMPTVYIADMRQELKKGNRSIISDQLRELMEDRLQKKEQVMLFLNRRGYAGFVSCRSCGHVVKCPHCDVTLAYHQGGKMVCHYCGYEIPELFSCPECGSKHIGRFRAGTQQVEDLVKREFPQARVLRMDMDTTKNKDGHEKILSAFANEEADILVGTQMIVKGHDFPMVTLVGILAADMSLYASDYMSSERTFQLLTQAAGRAGRGEQPGEVVIQTYSPEHYAIALAAKQDYDSFYREEIDFRQLCGYPPASYMMAVYMEEEDEDHLEKAMGYLKMLVKKADKGKKIRIIGPATPHVSKVKDLYRRILYLKSEDEAYLLHTKNIMERYIDMNLGFKTIHIQFDKA